MSKLLGFLSTVSLIGALICFAAIKLPISGYVTTAQMWMPLLLLIGIGSAVASFFFKVVSKLILVLIIAVLIGLAYFGLRG